MKLCWAVLLGLLGCSTPNPNVRVRRLPHGPLQVDGPLLGPFKTLEELAANACTLMTSQPGASTGQLGVEYCALYYYSVEDEAYFLSYLSNINGDMPSGVKACTVPRELNDARHKSAIILGPAHTHTGTRELSPVDMGGELAPGETPVGPSKVFNEATGRVWERQLLMFRQEGRKEPCRAYSYNYATRAVSALRDGAWVPIGEAKGGSGSFKKGEGPGWPP